MNKHSIKGLGRSLEVKNSDKATRSLDHTKRSPKDRDLESPAMKVRYDNFDETTAPLDHTKVPAKYPDFEPLAMKELHDSLRLRNTLLLADLLELGAYESAMEKNAPKYMDRLPESCGIRPTEAANLSPLRWVEVFENLRRQACRGVSSALEDMPRGVAIHALAQEFANLCHYGYKSTAETEQYLAMFRGIVWFCLFNGYQDNEPGDTRFVIYP